MKLIKKYKGTTAAIIGLFLFSACADDIDLRIPYPNDITFNEISLDRFSYEIPAGPFTAGDQKSGIITVNVNNNGNGDYSGFALSNKNFRSYPWELSPDFAPAGGLTPAEEQAAINTTAFSVYTTRVNPMKNYLVGKATGDDAYFTLSEPTTVEHVLVANTTYNYLLASYGSILSEDIDPVTQEYLLTGGKRDNPGIENDDPNLQGVFTLPGIDGTLKTIRLAGTELLAKHEAGDPAGIAAGEAARDAFIANNPGSTPEEQQAVYDEAYEEAYDEAADAIHKGYVKLTIEGFLNGTTTGTVDVYLAIRPEVDPAFPEYNYILRDWRKVDLTSLGTVDKVLFKMSSDYVDNQGKMVYPSLFCLDGIRLQ
ncbi:DUF4465 domain-containing protein [Flavobacteriaceae bacterium F08102]|nr:DUF4465 domain-containing protein [Flavobacteriaceae bacterium F08102]